MKTSTLLIAAAAVVGGVILYEQLKPTPQTTSPLVQVTSGIVQGLGSLFTSSRTASSSDTQPVQSRLGEIDLSQSSFSKRAPGWDSLGVAT